MPETLTFEQLPGAVCQINNKTDRIEKMVSELFEKLNNSQSQTQDELFTIDEASEFLNLKNPTIYSLVSRGELPVMKRSKRLYFSKLELINYLKQGRNKTNSEVESEAKHFLNKKR